MLSSTLKLKVKTQNSSLAIMLTLFIGHWSWRNFCELAATSEMGNCQAAEAATVVIQHPSNKIERIYWSVSANEIMNSNPGHYVALVVTSPTLKSENGLPLKQLKLLRPDDTLSIGNVYHLISFEDVLKEFAAKKCMKLGRLLKERGGRDRLEVKTNISSGPKPNPTQNSPFGHIPGFLLTYR
ncbi:uncharacterized protein LOC116131395 [Pistacia vera]|uniref:uncharacterized protein LOC116131395 n=1 Tax=Pistacia vera TaxID=55513 RepID=UPI00126364D3|nr:uncharacterized protein LOC116131395 [Pistacia vera]